MTPSLVRLATSALDEKLETMRVKLEQLKMRQARRDETRRKILIAATILARIERGGDRKKLGAMLDEALVRKDDRALFGL